MGGLGLKGALRFVRALGSAPGQADAGDAELLGQFVERRDEAAFAALLARHGPLVLGACRQVLDNPQDAEDAFQATFLVLARKAGSVRRGESLAGWLHRVALNVARTARADHARRRARERQVAPMTEAGPAEGEPPRDWQAVLHEEVDRLPDRYRLPVVLCYLEGQTHEGAARSLGWPLGTVKGRLARARDQLRGRLARRGVTLSAGALAGALAVPPTLLGQTLRAALSFAARGATPAGAASARALALAKGALQPMTATKLAQATVWLLGTGVVVFAALGAGLGSSAPAPGPKESAASEVAFRAPAPLVSPSPALEYGPEVKGLRASVTLPRQKFRVGEPIVPEYVVKNVSRTNQVVWNCGFWGNHEVIVRDSTGREPPWTDMGRQFRASFLRGPRTKEVPQVLKPGEVDASQGWYDLTRFVDLSRPGRYTVQYFYEETGGATWHGRLPSNVAAFEVVARAKGIENVWVEELVADLASADGKRRAAATAEVFRRGRHLLPALRKAGAKQIAPTGGTTSTRRLDMVYSLLKGLPPNDPGARPGYHTTSFGLHLVDGSTAEEVEAMGKKYGFSPFAAPSPGAAPQCYARVPEGALPTVLRRLLSEEPKVITVNLNYFERD
jgi:RNA polymerase sigma factor (sigma-70 family)